MRVFFCVFLLLVFSMSSMANEKFSVFSGDGEGSSVSAIINSTNEVDVLFLGESHNDKVAHQLQLQIFKEIIEKHADKRTVILSLEMFERDVQVVIDEYFKGLISESHFLKSSRPWNNYQQDYRPLVELAREKGLRVVAANAPRRYVNTVFRKGIKPLSGLSDQAKLWIAPLPFEKASDKYVAQFVKTFGSGSDHSAFSADSTMIQAQSLWDATMADSIKTAMEGVKNPLVIHVNGSFHSAYGLGVPEHLVRYRPGTKFGVVTMKYVKDFESFDPKDKGLGDFVVLTDAAEPRSFE